MLCWCGQLICSNSTEGHLSGCAVMCSLHRLLLQVVMIMMTMMEKLCLAKFHTSMVLFCRYLSCLTRVKKPFQYEEWCSRGECSIKLNIKLK